METPRAIRISVVVVVLALLVVLVVGRRGLSRPRSWNAQTEPARSRYARLVEEAREWVRPIQVSELRRRLAVDPKLRLIDVREESEWAAGRIPGAIHLSKGVIERDIEAAVPDVADDIVLYCAGGSRSVLAAENLRRMGYVSVYSLEGGYRAWRADAGSAAPFDAASSK
ncbi:MAG: hypothetical protein HY403_10855 [Elusimicrobia bacterium]|nr:hypothetical protein [Elusimicrobiota bacterium]